MARGRFAESLATCERTAAAALELGDPVSHSLADMAASWVDLFQGRGDAAVARMRDCEARVIAKGAFIAIPTTRIELGRALASLGELDEAREPLDLVVASGADGGWHYCRALLALADVLRAQGHADDAHARATEALELAGRLGTRAQQARASEILAQLRIDAGDWHKAEAIFHDALAHRVDIGAPVWIPQVLDGLAEVATGLASYQEAARLLGAANRARHDLGSTRWPLLAQGIARTDETLRATLGDSGYDAAIEEGAAMSLEQVVAWVRRARGVRKRPASGWESLTPTELEVVELVAEGLTNPQIGQRLFISAGTAKIHLQHVFEKLGVHSRSEVAVLAARRET
jgi:DNA-binding CsgD family transcriptional regulator